MKNQRLIALALALLVCASTAMVSCSSDKTDGIDTSGADTVTQTVGQNLPTGDDAPETAEDTAPAPVIDVPPANEVDDIPNQNPAQNTPTDVPSTDDPSSDIPAVEMPEEDTDDDEPYIPPVDVGALEGLIGQRDSGRFESAQSKNLVLFIDWESVIGDDGVADVAVTVGISHYQFFSREKYNMGAIQVDGNAVLFSTPEISYDEAVKTQTVFYTAQYETSRSEMEIEVSWQVLGNYGGVDIDALTAGGTIVLNPNS